LPNANICYENRFWWSLLVGVDWWDAVGCTQSAAEDGIGKAALSSMPFAIFLFKFMPEKGEYSLLFHIYILGLASDPFFYLVSVSLNSVIAVLDADFHSLPSIQHRQQYGPVCYR